MYKVIAVLICVFMFGSCSVEKELTPLNMLRQSMQQSQGCEFDVQIISQYDDRVYRFGLHCVESDGELRFEVLSPESVQGITGTVSESGGKLAFDTTLLAFPLLADGEVSPVISPWLFIRCLKNGLVRHAGGAEDGSQISFSESFRGEEFEAEVLLSEDGTPRSCELFWGGRRILHLQVEAFRIL